MSQAASLDHAGIVGPDLAALATAFERLGFTLTPLARHAGGRTGNRCIMLHGSYIELLATMPGGTSATLDRMLARHAGIHILALGIEDEVAARSRLQRAGIDAPAPVVTERAVDDLDPDGPRARFVLVSPPDGPEGRVHLIRHETPDALWQPAFMAHPNMAFALIEILVASDAPAETAARLSRLAGRPVVPDASGGFALDLPRGRIRMLPGGSAGPVPRFAGLTIATADANAAITARLADGAMPHRKEADGIVVQAGGTTVRFVAGPPAA
jgi:hypothetical protein